MFASFASVAPLAPTAPILALPAAGTDPFARCDALLVEAPERWESARCFYEVGLSEGRWPDAADLLAARERQLPQRPWLALARAYVEKERDPGNAAAWYRKAIAAFVAVHHIDGEVRARCAFADWLATRREPGAAGAAEAELDRAVRSAETAGASGALAEALIFKARQRRSGSKDLQETYRLARRAESLLFPRGDAVRQMLCLELLANLERDLGHAHRAEGLYRRLETLARANHRPSLEAIAQTALGLLLVEELDRAPRSSGRERALHQLRRAIESAHAVGNPQLEATARSSLDLVLDPKERRENLDRCLALVRGRHYGLTVSCLLGLARLQAEADPAAAERALAEAQGAAERSGDPATLARLAYGRMNLRWILGPREAAVADAEAAIHAVEALRDRQLEQLGRTGLFSRWLAPYYAAAGHLLAAFQESGDPRDLDLGFAVTESLRARVLRDLLAARRDAEPPISRAALEGALGPDEAILSFQLAPRRDLYGFAGGSWLLVVSRQGTRVYPLSQSVDRARLESATSVLSGMIARRAAAGEPATAETELAEVLGRELLGPALADLPPNVSRLVILPDGVLHLLPFAALRLEPGGPPLAERYRLSIASSATLWERWRRQPRRPARAALVLADPALPSDLAAAPLRDAAPSAPLPGARREGRLVARYLGSGSRLRIGAEAGEAFVKRQDLSRFGLLHFAAHGVADEEDPETSAVLLARDGAGEDGRLQVDEIARLDLLGSLVALSSCRSAAGALVAGEGVMSLTRAFFAAGASVVLGSLWPIRDDDAEAFFAVFYDRLAAGETASAAFAAAQRERLRAGAPTEAWAGFVLSGDGDWRLPPPESAARGTQVSALFRIAIWGSVLLLAAGFAILALRSRRRRDPNGRKITFRSG